MIVKSGIRQGLITQKNLLVYTQIVFRMIVYGIDGIKVR